MLLAELRVPDAAAIFSGEDKFIASHRKDEKCRGCSRQNEMYLRSVSPIKFEVILGSDMRTLFAILGLLLCLSPARADELPVIKDSEAVEYVGEKCRGTGVRGLRYRDHPTRDRIYQFRTRISQSDVHWVHMQPTPQKWRLTS